MYCFLMKKVIKSWKNIILPNSNAFHQEKRERISGPRWSDNSDLSDKFISEEKKKVLYLGYLNQKNAGDIEIIWINKS